MKSTAEIVYDQAVRAVEQQVTQLDELRTRTAVVLAASGVVTGFLGRAAVDKGFGAFAYLAVAAFVVSALACIWVLLPRWEAWAFSIDATSLIPYFLHETEPEPPDALFEYLAKEIHKDHIENSQLLSRLFAGFTWACISLAVEVVLWFLALL